MVEVARFLVVDDNREFAVDLCELLEMQGAHGTVATYADEALELLGRTTFHGLFTDLRLPGKSGVELIEEMSRRQISLPVVLMTAYPDEELVTRARLAGVLDVLSKPLIMEQWVALTLVMSSSCCHDVPAHRAPANPSNTQGSY